MRPSEKKDRSSVNGISRTTVTGQIASEPRGCPRSSRVGYPQQREFASAHTRKKSRHNGILSSSPPLCLIPSRLEPVLCRVVFTHERGKEERRVARDRCAQVYTHTKHIHADKTVTYTLSFQCVLCWPLRLRVHSLSYIVYMGRCYASCGCR